ncbi:MAG TPA: helix-turn-helix domain-containing protein [Solirubrobacteraceae bacterium]|nr:helix-turn-helix domain-containing protein [Solirubrobacteraceae bacterium]
MPCDATVRLDAKLDPRDGWSAEPCSIAGTLAVVSTRSAFLILREAFYGATRFDEFVRRVAIGEPAAAARLRELVRHGLLEREPYRDAGQRTRHRYRLTAKGADLFPALVALMQWGDRWRDDAGAPVALVHDGCGARAAVRLRCEAGHDVGPADLVLTPTAAGESWLRSRSEHPSGGGR